MHQTCPKRRFLNSINQKAAIFPRQLVTIDDSLQQHGQLFGIQYEQLNSELSRQLSCQADGPIPRPSRTEAVPAEQVPLRVLALADVAYPVLTQLPLQGGSSAL